MKYLFKNVGIVDPASSREGLHEGLVDLLVADGIIEKIGGSVSAPEGAAQFDMKGVIFTPGLLDMHVHFREPGFEYKETIESGCQAAAAGGFTGACCMPNTNPAIDNESLVKSVIDKGRMACDGIIDLYPIASVTKKREGIELSPMLELARAGAVAFSDDGSCVGSSEVLRRAMEYSKMVSKPIIQHAEDSGLAKGGVMNEGFISTLLGLTPIPEVAETIPLARDLLMAEYTRSRYHAAHISTRRSMELIAEAKNRGTKATCEVTPHHFTLSDEAVRWYDTNTKMNPPLRSKEDMMAMKEGLRDGIIDVIATDHAPHSFDDKEVEYNFAPFGIIGLETAIGLAITELVLPGYLSLGQLVEKLSVNPRKILNLPPVTIAEGERANISMIRPDIKWVVDLKQFRSRSRNSPFDGWKLTGRAVGIFNNGIFLQNEQK